MANIAALRGTPDQPFCTPASELKTCDHQLQRKLDVAAFNPLLSNGLSRGSIIEVTGERSTGRTTVCLHFLAQASQAGEICAIVDTHNQFHPETAARAGVHLDRLLWIRCQGDAEHAIRATDLLLHAGGFGIVWLDLCEVSHKLLNRIPLSYWYRFRRVIEHSATILLLCADVPQAKSSFVHGLTLNRKNIRFAQGTPLSFWHGISITATLQQPSRFAQTASLSIKA